MSLLGLDLTFGPQHTQKILILGILRFENGIEVDEEVIGCTLSFFCFGVLEI